ncbi:Triosephosphate isomerase [Acidisarcina polymorpha]|uniref:Triosephosphate isomerase n=1 Tax=Acidisarcina polymorpha TaxID=2211140 RepID=A0A2Z5FSF7_9BACT|nr:triose-phosphate isomerase [Acidisarcina polymorpha]AXC09407.1 Triosephosphate isomerase [Acidisarcina polymorpha]
MSRKPLIAANWKMYKTPAEARSCAEALLKSLQDHTRDEIAICPPFVSLSIVLDTLSGSNLAVGAQNMHFADEGAYTGEISPPMLTSIGVTYVILGHSERRQYFNETDELVNQKLHAAFRHKLSPILCVGEKLEEREHNLTEEVLMRQIELALRNVSPNDASSLVIAYEPIWAIGTGKTATPEMAAEAHLLIRSQVARRLDRKSADNLRILYGGSVRPDNAPSLLNQPEIDGALVGGASLNPESFIKLVRY